MNLQQLYAKELQFIEGIEKLYVYLEHIKIKEAKLFSDSSKANLRRSQSELQHMRLLLYDLLEEMKSDIDRKEKRWGRQFRLFVFNLVSPEKQDTIW